MFIHVLREKQIKMFEFANSIDLYLYLSFLDKQIYRSSNVHWTETYQNRLFLRISLQNSTNNPSRTFLAFEIV